MNDESWERYQALHVAYPELFKNPTSDGIRIVEDKEEVQSCKTFRDRLIRQKSFPADWGHLGVVFEDEYIIIVRDPVFIPAKGEFRSYLRIIEKPPTVPAVVVFAVYDEKVVILHHFRHSVRAWSLEIPRGLGATGDWREDASRELLEEVGGVAQRLVNLGPLCTNSGMFGTVANVVYSELSALDSSKISREEQDLGIGKIELLSPERFRECMKKGLICDSYTLSAACLVAVSGIDNRWVGG